MISGVYNYCDRWCERCRLADRCAIYDGGQDADKTDFVEQLHKSFTETLQFLEETILAKGIQMPTPEENEASLILLKEKEEAVKQKLLHKTSYQYTIQCREWNKTHRHGINEHLEILLKKVKMGILAKEIGIAEVKLFQDCWEIINWYEMFIYAKFDRALLGLENDEDLDEGFSKDSDGSAKIALIAAERSLQAWVKMYKKIPHLGDSMLPLMAKLQKIIELGDSTFQNARAFVRPGFDEDV